MTNHKVLAPRWSISVKSVVDFAIGRIHANLQRPHKNGSTIGNLADMRLRLIEQPGCCNLSKVDAVGFTRNDGDSFHGESDSSEGVAETKALATECHSVGQCSWQERAIPSLQVSEDSRTLRSLQEIAQASKPQVSKQAVHQAIPNTGEWISAQEQEKIRARL